jgi:hypothetical protein
MVPAGEGGRVRRELRGPDQGAGQAGMDGGGGGLPPRDGQEGIVGLQDPLVHVL